MTASPSKRNSRKRGLSLPSHTFRLYVLLCIGYNVGQFASSQKKASPNISQSAASGVLNDIQKRSNKDDKTFSNAKEKCKMKNETKLNASLSVVQESKFNYFEKIEKPKIIFREVKQEKSKQDIRGDQKRQFNDLLTVGVVEAKVWNGLQNVSNKKNPLLFKKNPISTCFQGKQKKWAENARRNFDIGKAAITLKIPKLKPISPLKKDKNDEDDDSAMDTTLCLAFALILFSILALNILYLFLEVIKTGDSRFNLQNLISCKTKWSRTLLIAFSLLLSHTAVVSDVTVSTTEGTYFQNDAPGRYLLGYVNESSEVYDLIVCQMRCNRLHSICKSLNYIKNEDGPNICEINHEAQYCVLPGEFILKENSFYVETVPELDDAGLCFVCGYKGVIKQTKEKPGFKCLCQEEFDGDRCQHKAVCSLPCLNGGRCVRPGTCRCVVGYFGSQCQEARLSSSVILQGRQDYIKLLQQWLSYPKSQLCYRATRDGWRSTDFHSKCDNKGPTVTIVRVGIYIFGGYTDQPWDSSSGSKTSSSSFIFSLINNDNLAPFKAPVYRYSQLAIYCGGGYGPLFGGGNDLHIANNANSNTNSYSYLGYTYQPPSGYIYGKANTKVLLAGSHDFSPSEVEVFYLL